MEFSRSKTATFEFDNCYINQDILEQFLTQYNVWEDEWKQYILGRMIANYPRGLGKVNTWWYNIFRISEILFEFNDKMKKEYDAIGNPYHFDYGHYFVKEKYDLEYKITYHPFTESFTMEHPAQWQPVTLEKYFERKK